MAYWLLKNYHESVDVFLISFQESLKKGSDNHFDYPSIFNFYAYLKMHPLLRRRHLTQHCEPSTSSAASINSHPSFSHQVSLLKQSSASVTYQLQKSLCFHTACIHLYSGLPDIALEVLSMLPQEEGSIENQQKTDVSSLPSKNSKDEAMIVTGTFSGDLSTSVFSNENTSFAIAPESSTHISSGWGGDDYDVGLTNRFGDLDDGYKIGISLSDEDEDDDNENVQLEKVEQNEDESDNQLDMKISVDNVTSDKAALNLKFRCILQLLIEGLKALPSKCTLEKLKLRKTLKSMVQRELEYLHSICNLGKKNDNLLQKYESSNDTVQQYLGRNLHARLFMLIKQNIIL